MKREGKRGGNGREMMGQDGMRQDRKRKGKNGNGTRWKKGREKEGSKRMEQDRTEKARKGSGRIG